MRHDDEHITGYKNRKSRVENTGKCKLENQSFEANGTNICGQ